LKSRSEGSKLVGEVARLIGKANTGSRSDNSSVTTTRQPLKERRNGAKKEEQEKM
jgi:hypothetical protein